MALYQHVRARSLVWLPSQCSLKKQSRGDVGAWRLAVCQHALVRSLVLLSSQCVLSQQSLVEVGAWVCRWSHVCQVESRSLELVYWSVDAKFGTARKF